MIALISRRCHKPIIDDCLPLVILRLEKGPAVALFFISKGHRPKAIKELAIVKYIVAIKASQKAGCL